LFLSNQKHSFLGIFLRAAGQRQFLEGVLSEIDNVSLTSNAAEAMA
jgi:hypothetical protein